MSLAFGHVRNAPTAHLEADRSLNEFDFGAATEAGKQAATAVSASPQTH